MGRESNVHERKLVCGCLGHLQASDLHFGAEFSDAAETRRIYCLRLRNVLTCIVAIRWCLPFSLNAVLIGCFEALLQMTG